MWIQPWRDTINPSNSYRTLFISVISEVKNKMTKSINKKIQGVASKFLKNDKAQMGGVGTLYAVFFAAIVVLAIIIIFTFIPGIGSTVEQSTPAAPAYCTNATSAATCAASQVPGGQWNSSDTNNPNAAALKTSSGAAIWTSTSGMLKVAMIIGIVVIILGSLFAIFAARKAEQGGGGGGGGM